MSCSFIFLAFLACFTPCNGLYAILWCFPSVLSFRLKTCFKPFHGFISVITALIYAVVFFAIIEKRHLNYFKCLFFTYEIFKLCFAKWSLPFPLRLKTAVFHFQAVLNSSKGNNRQRSDIPLPCHRRTVLRRLLFDVITLSTFRVVHVATQRIVRLTEC